MQLADSTNVLVFVVRHGQTTLNRENRFRGTANPPLDATGIRQARDVAKLLDAIEISHIFSSDKQRATKTADIIASGDGNKVHKTENLRDQSRKPELNASYSVHLACRPKRKLDKTGVE